MCSASSTSGDPGREGQRFERSRKVKTQAIVFCIGIASLIFGSMQVGKAPAKKDAPDKSDKAIIQVNQRFAQAKPDDYIGDQACVECHTSTSHSFNASAHFASMSDPSLPLAKRGCEGCHGPGK